MKALREKTVRDRLERIALRIEVERRERVFTCYDKIDSMLLKALRQVIETWGPLS